MELTREKTLLSSMDGYNLKFTIFILPGRDMILVVVLFYSFLHTKKTRIPRKKKKPPMKL